MIKRILIPLIAVFGLIFGMVMVYRGSLTPPVAPLKYHPPRSPYKVHIAAEGIIESGGENYSLGVPFSQLISKVYVHVGDTVVQGQPLFELDIRQLVADQAVAQAAYVLACTHFALQSQQFLYYQQLVDKNAVSKKEYTAAYYAKQEALSRVRVALAQIRQIGMQIERSTICSPVDGVILKDEVRVGEVANQNSFSKMPFVVCGNVDYVQVRIDIAEEDAWRYIPGACATAFVRGNADIVIPLEFDYVEPLIVPKKTLTGSDMEAVDTRVLQVLYRFNKDQYPIYVGQLLDVYIQAHEQSYRNNQEYNDDVQ